MRAIVAGLPAVVFSAGGGGGGRCNHDRANPEEARRGTLLLPTSRQRTPTDYEGFWARPGGVSILFQRLHPGCEERHLDVGERGAGDLEGVGAGVERQAEYRGKEAIGPHERTPP